ncbi:MAG: hypothetical protein U0V74_09320 [Chitinophagales bacterium]
MRKQDYVIELIRSLSPNESRYFKLFSSIQPGDKKYLELFEKLEGKESYDAQELCTELGISRKQLTDSKYYLQQMLLRALRNFTEQSASEASVFTARDNIRVLESRRLFDYSLDLIDKTLERAYEMFLTELILELLNMKVIMLYNLQRYEESAAVKDEALAVLAMQKEIFELHTLKALGSKYEIQRDKSEEFNALVKHAILSQAPEKLKSLRAKIAWFDIMYRFYLTHNDLNKVVEVVRSEYECYKAYPIVKRSNVTAYFTNFTRLALTEHQLGNGERALELAEELKQFLADPANLIPKARRESFTAYSENFRMYVLLRLGRTEQVIKESPVIIEAMKSRTPAEQFAHKYNYALALSLSKNYNKAVDVLNELMGVDPEVRTDIHQLTRILLVMVHIDLGNLTMVPYLVKSAKAWMKRNKYSSKDIDELFKYLLSAARLTGRARQQHYQSMLSLYEEGKFSSLSDMLLLPKWLQQRVQKT